jgi:invasion protein IalB
MRFGLLKALVLCACWLAVGVLTPTEGSAAPKNGQKFGNWFIRCSEGPTPECLLVQSLNVQNGGRVLELSIGKVGTKGEFGSIAMVPLGIHIPSGVILVIDGKQVPMTLLKCVQEGCQAVAPLTKAHTDLMKKAKLVAVGFVDEFTRKALSIGLGIDGLKDGLAALN